jgi:hypothetical protein
MIVGYRAATKLQHFRDTTPKEYSDYDKALFYLKSTLNIFDGTHDELLHNYIEDHWRRGDGRLFMDDKTTYVKLSWMPKDMDLEMKL